jgi:hypothetical protein
MDIQEQILREIKRTNELLIAFNGEQMKTTVDKIIPEAERINTTEK